MNILAKMRDKYISKYSEEKQNLEKWMFENKDIEGSLIYEGSKIGVALYGLYVEFWTAMKK